jgi:hypothetical protein
LLNAASKVANSLAGDPQVERILTVFNKFPKADRETLLNVLQREANYKAVESTVGGITGLGLRPNPNAKFYVRVIDEEKVVSLAEKEPPADHDRIVLTSMRAMRTVISAIAPIYSRWKRATQDALAALSPEERGTIAKLARDVLTMVEDADRASSTAKSA